MTRPSGPRCRWESGPLPRAEGVSAWVGVPRPSFGQFNEQFNLYRYIDRYISV